MARVRIRVRVRYVFESRSRVRVRVRHGLEWFRMAAQSIRTASSKSGSSISLTLE